MCLWSAVGLLGSFTDLRWTISYVWGLSWDFSASLPLMQISSCKRLTQVCWYVLMANVEEGKTAWKPTKSFEV